MTRWYAKWSIRGWGLFPYAELRRLSFGLGGDTLRGGDGSFTIEIFIGPVYLRLDVEEPRASD